MRRRKQHIPISDATLYAPRTLAEIRRPLLPRRIRIVREPAPLPEPPPIPGMSAHELSQARIQARKFL